METVLEMLIYNDRVKAGLVVGIVKALKGDLEDGYLQTLPELVRAEMFENFNEMARHLLEEGYKDAAAVIASVSLESHLHRLAVKHGIQLSQTGRDRSIKHKKANQLNQELHKSGAYRLFDQKQLTVWLDLRNNAAHGKYDAYDKDQVSKLIEWTSSLRILPKNSSQDSACVPHADAHCFAPKCSKPLGCRFQMRLLSTILIVSG